MKKTSTKTATFRTFEAAKLSAGKYAGMGVNRSEEREHEGRFFTYYSSSSRNVSRDWYGIKAADVAAIGYDCLGFWDIPAGLKAAALMVCRISDYSSNFRFCLDRSGAWMFHYHSPEGFEYSNGSAEDVRGDRVEMDDDQNARDFVWALSRFERVQLWKKGSKIFMAVGSIDDGRLLLLNAGVNARFTAAEDDVWTVDPAAEIVAAVANYPAAPVAACEAPKADDSDDQEINAAPVSYKMVYNYDFNGVEVYFSTYPGREIVDRVKGLGMRWHGIKKCWYGKPSKGATEEAIVAAIGYGPDNQTETAQEGENVRGGAEVPPEEETAPEAKETAKAEAVPDSVRNYGKAGAMLETLESPVSEGESLPEHWRRVWKACGLKGVTVSSRRGGYTRSYTFKFTMIPGDLLQFEKCREALEVQARERLARGVWDDEKGGYIDYFHMTGDEQRAEETRQARKYYEKVKAEGSRFSICHYWQINRKNIPEFSESFWRRWELVGRSVARFNYDRSDAMTDYFDVGFYEDWEIKPEGKVTYKPAEWYAIDNLYNLAKARDEKAEAKSSAARYTAVAWRNGGRAWRGWRPLRTRTRWPWRGASWNLGKRHRCRRGGGNPSNRQKFYKLKSKSKRRIKP